MAKANSTTPKFTFLFLATKPGDKCAPVVLRTAADTEEAARAFFPGWNLTFAAKIRTASPVNFSWIDYVNLSQWSVTASDISEQPDALNNSEG